MRGLTGLRSKLQILVGDISDWRDECVLRLPHHRMLSVSAAGQMYPRESERVWELS